MSGVRYGGRSVPWFERDCRTQVMAAIRPTHYLFFAARASGSNPGPGFAVFSMVAVNSRMRCDVYAPLARR
jgi:hypothetical protein